MHSYCASYLYFCLCFMCVQFVTLLAITQCAYFSVRPAVSSLAVLVSPQTSTTEQEEPSERLPLHAGNTSLRDDATAQRIVERCATSTGSQTYVVHVNIAGFHENDNGRCIWLWALKAIRGKPASGWTSTSYNSFGWAWACCDGQGHSMNVVYSVSNYTFTLW